jgi:hypothetical protein
MKLRFGTVVIILGISMSAAFAQRSIRTETKPAESTLTRAEVANEAALARRSLTLRSKQQAARFQQVAVALNLTNRQKSSIGSLVQGTRQQLAAIGSNSSLSPEQQQQAEQAVKLGMAQKFVGLLTPEQKDNLQELLLKKKQQQEANGNSSAAGSGASAPDIPSVDAPSGNDSNDAQDSSADQNSTTDASNSTGTANASTNPNTTASADASSSGSGSSVTTAASASAATSSAAPVAQVVAKTDVPTKTSANAKPGRLSDAQLAAILNSFVQDGPEDASSKAPQPASGSRS